MEKLIIKVTDLGTTVNDSGMAQHKRAENALLQNISWAVNPATSCLMEINSAAKNQAGKTGSLEFTTRTCKLL